MRRVAGRSSCLLQTRAPGRELDDLVREGWDSPLLDH